MSINMNKYRVPLTIEYFPSGVRYIPTSNSGEFASFDKKLAEILSFTPNFMEDIKLARKSLGIALPFEYPKNAEVKDLLLVFSKLKPKRKELDNLSEHITAKYDLTKNWTFSIKTAIVTDTLLIPESLGPILITQAEPFHLVEQIKRVSESEIREYLLTKRLLEAYQYPALRFTRKTTVNELNNWLKVHSSEFKQMQAVLPEKNEIKMFEDNIHWGYIAEMFMRWKSNPDYQGVISRLEDMLEQTGDETFPDIPSREELRNLHLEYLSLIKRFNFTN